jgi:hypothetical protein
MKIFIRSYQSPYIGNLSTDVMHIRDNKVTVAELKDMLYDKYKINQSQQRLTTKIVNKFIVTMTNEWPLSFFHIRENSKIYLEFIQVVDKVSSINSSLKKFKRKFSLMLSLSIINN